MKIQKLLIYCILFCTSLLLSCVGIAPVPKQTESRVALVIGNADYQFINKLKNPINDAKEMSNALENLGFDVIQELNANRQTMETAIKIFKQRLDRKRRQSKKTVGLFYYSGHGAQYGDENFLIPVTFDVSSYDNLDLIFESDIVLLNNVFKGMEDENIMKLVILDDCRENPFMTNIYQKGSKTIRIVPNIYKNSFIAYATAPYQIPYHDGGCNSLYTKHLLKRIHEPSVSIDTLFLNVGKAVMRETYNKQTPWIISSLNAYFYFVKNKR